MFNNNVQTDNLCSKGGALTRLAKEPMATLQGRYEFIETLGTGATSRVDKARDTLIGRSVALKTFLHGFGSRDVQELFLREAQIIGRLAHPCIVGLYDVGTDNDGVPYFVMEYVEGQTLEKVLDTSPLPFERALFWAADLTAAIARAHQAKVIHGDIKPANILITNDGQVKLGDFGIARFTTQVSSSGTLMGTPAYLSPEQILGHTQDTRSDLFSLGIILYQMTTGVRPFNGSSVKRGVRANRGDHSSSTFTPQRALAAGFRPHRHALPRKRSGEEVRDRRSVGGFFVFLCAWQGKNTGCVRTTFPV